MQVFFIRQKITIQFFRFSQVFGAIDDWENLLTRTHSRTHTHTRHTPRDNERFRKAAGRKISGRLAARHEKWNWTLLPQLCTRDWSNTIRPRIHRFYPYYQAHESPLPYNLDLLLLPLTNSHSYPDRAFWMKHVKYTSRGDIFARFTYNR